LTQFTVQNSFLGEFFILCDGKTSLRGKNGGAVFEHSGAVSIMIFLSGADVERGMKRTKPYVIRG
jgi:hypothetical protein